MGKCIYCGKNESTTRDHIPPKCFFPSPRPNNLITVPCCEECNNNFGKDDERVRNLLTSLASTENHLAIQSELESKRNRSFLRVEGKSNLQHMFDSFTPVDIFKEGNLIGKTLVLDLDQRVVDRFIERVARALIYYENDIGFFKGNSKWRLPPTEKEFETMPNELRKLICIAKMKEIGGKIFQYYGKFFPDKPGSFWILRFYDGFELMIFIKER